MQFLDYVSRVIQNKKKVLVKVLIVGIARRPQCLFYLKNACVEVSSTRQLVTLVGRAKCSLVHQLKVIHLNLSEVSFSSFDMFQAFYTRNTSICNVQY